MVTDTDPDPATAHLFAYDPAILRRHPTIRAGAVVARGLRNGPSPAALQAQYQTQQRASLQQLAATPLAEVPSIAAWRRVFASFGAKPTQHRNAAEALLRRLRTHGDIPAINTLVDIGNLVSIRHAMPVAVLDLADISGGITVRQATGDEPFTDLGSTTTTSPRPGEVVFVDGEGIVSARRWCWRQSAQSATGATTTAALFLVEGHHESAQEDVAAAAADLTELLADHHAGSKVRSHLLSPTAPRIG